MNGADNSLAKMTWNSTLRDIVLHHLDIQVPSPWGDMTLREMLIYPSGSSAADLSSMAGLHEDVEREEIIKRLRFLPQDDNFRMSNHFSNIMYTVAGHVAERLSQMTWSELIKVRVFDKQSMNAPSFTPEGMDLPDAALPYRYHATGQPDNFHVQNKTLFNLRPFEPVGSLMAAAEDVTKWMRHVLYSVNAKGSDSGENHLIKDAFQSWVTSPATSSENSIGSDLDKPTGYGMGWYISTYRDLTSYKFKGSLYAYSAQIWLFPEVQTGIYVAVNGPGGDNVTQAIDGIMYHISDTVLRKTTWVTKDMLCCCQSSYEQHEGLHSDLAGDERPPMESRLIHYLAPLQVYTGIYGNGIVGDLVVESNDANVLEMKLGRNLVGHLMPDGLPTRMKFLATGLLASTTEWSTNKTVEFFKHQQIESVSGNDPFQAVKVFVNDLLVYEFHREKSFKSLLLIAEEADEQLIHEHASDLTTEKVVTESHHITDQSTELSHLNSGEDNHDEYDAGHQDSVERQGNDSIVPNHMETPNHGPTETTDHSASETDDQSNVKDSHEDFPEGDHQDHLETGHPRNNTSNEHDHLPEYNEHLNHESHIQVEPKQTRDPLNENLNEIDDQTTDNDESLETKHKNIDNSMGGKYRPNKGDSHDNDIADHQSHEPVSSETEPDFDDQQKKDAEMQRRIKEDKRKVNDRNMSTRWQPSGCLTIVALLFSLVLLGH
uniref:Beta-lactamase-related domain-containing protein n=1 Tax=Biomphalaria glabrata TaxID=6526 RepID=A0A2C9LW09_BIOGL